MIKAGIDVGSKSVKMVIMQDGRILAKSSSLSGIDLNQAVEDVFEKIVREAKINRDDIGEILSTGVEADFVSFSPKKVSIVTAISKASNFFLKEEKLVVDVGAEEIRAVKCDGQGRIDDFVLNDKCAAGAGIFIEAISRALEIKLEEMGPLSLKTEKTTPIDTQCVIFAESEVVSLIHRKVPKEEIARSVYDSMANRVYSMVNKLGIGKNVMLVGGVAKDVGFVDAVKRKLKTDLIIPDDAEFAGAIGVCL